VKVRNVHERVLVAPASRVGALLDGLASSEDALWPHQAWPAMKFDRPLQVGAIGGHGPIRYGVEEYEPGRSILFRFTAPRGFDGTHGLTVERVDKDRTRLSHVLEMRASGPAKLSWPVVFRPLHDALVEDALDRAERHLGVTPRPRQWSPWVKVLRWMLAGRRGRGGADKTGTGDGRSS